MVNIEYTITFYGYWHVGGKDGTTMQLDNATLKTKDGLPYIGGKTLKGLILDGAKLVNTHDNTNTLMNDDFIKTVFGAKNEEYLNRKEDDNHFSSAFLAEPIQSKYRKYLYHLKHSTAVGANKQAVTHSLRTTEGVVPLVLKGEITNFTGNRIQLEWAMKAVKKLGEKRFRGYGRCIFEITKPETDA